VRNIQIGRWFVQEQHIGLRREAAGNEHTLAFAAGQLQHRTRGEMPHIGAAQGVINKHMIMLVQMFETPQVWISAHLDDLAHGERHAHVGILRHKDDALRQGTPRQGSQVVTVQGHMAFAGGKQTRQEA
jgi:hypothetical protein